MAKSILPGKSQSTFGLNPKISGQVFLRTASLWGKEAEMGRGGGVVAKGEKGDKKVADTLKPCHHRAASPYRGCEGTAPVASACGVTGAYP